MSRQPIRVPAQHILSLASVIQSVQDRVIASGGRRDELEVLVTDGELELVDATGTYGVRRWGRGGVR